MTYFKHQIPIIYDNVIFSLQRIGGVSIYWFELISRLVKSDEDIKYYESSNVNIIRKNIDISIKKESIIPVAILRYIPFLVPIDEPVLFHSSYYRVCLNKNAINILTVHDFTYELCMKGFRRYVHIFQKRYAIFKADGIICISQNTKNDLLSLYPNIDPRKIRVIYNGSSNGYFPLKNSKNDIKNSKFSALAKEKYMLFIGERGGYKNFDIAVKVASLFPGVSLVAVGGQPITYTENKNVGSRNVKLHHYFGVPEKELNLLYNNAFCLLHPSSYEGFGIPLLEAMSAGCPVVALNSSSVPEVVEDSALLVDQLCEFKFQQKMKYLYDPSFRSELVKKGLHRASVFSWDKTYSETLEFYQAIWGQTHYV
jgi:mannosyltransferase